MKQIIRLLKSPLDGAPLSIKGNFLVSEKGSRFPWDGNLVNFLSGKINKNKATEQAASFRWEHSRRLKEDKGFIRHQLSDFLLRYGFKDKEAFSSYLKNVKTVAEIGAGEGRMVDWFLKYSKATVFALELSDSVYYLKEKYKGNKRVIVLKADALYHPFSEGSIDFLSCEQCIHHTDHPRKIFNSLCKALSPGGKVIISMYAKKSPVREKMDAIIRDGIAQLPSEKKYEISQQITGISKILSEIDVNVKVPRNFQEFGDLRGQEMPLQRFFYYSVFKCFWNKDFTFEKSAEFNHDWYSYPVCNKVTIKDAVNWFSGNNISVEHKDENFSNVNLRGKRRK